MTTMISSIAIGVVLGTVAAAAFAFTTAFDPPQHPLRWLDGMNTRSVHAEQCWPTQVAEGRLRAIGYTRLTPVQVRDARMGTVWRGNGDDVTLIHRGKLRCRRD